VVGLFVATAVIGAPEPFSQAFIDDQQDLYDAAQFSNPLLYPPGYRWRIDVQLEPGDIVAAALTHDRTGAWVIDLTFDARVPSVSRPTPNRRQPHRRGAHSTAWASSPSGR
jgi:hypothetical protein